MKKILSILLVIFVTITFIACGGGGNGNSSSSTNINITVICTTTPPNNPSLSDIATYHEIFSGDSIVQDNASSSIQIYTPIGLNSRVCLESGSAQIVRN